MSKHILLYPDMSPEAENLIAYYFLEAINKAQCNYHHRNTYHGSGNRQPDNESWKSFLFVESNAFCYKGRNIQTV